MKFLPLHSLPPARLAALASRGARESRAARLERVRAHWHDQDRGPRGCGPMAVIGIVLLGCGATAVCAAGWLVAWFF